METARDVQASIDGLIDSTWTFSTLVAAVEVGLADTLDSPSTGAEAAAKVGLSATVATALLDVLVSIGLVQREDDRYQGSPGFREFLRASQSEDILAWLRSAHWQSRAMVDAAHRGELRPGWEHTDPEILQAQGRAGRASVHTLAAQVFPMLSGLQERLSSPGGNFLDIGLGVGVISIELCQIYPHLRVVGLEPGPVQAEEARRNIAAAGLTHRIEVRAQRLEDLADRDAYDLVYLPQVFMPVEVVKTGLERILKALRPGGWISLVAFDAPGDGLTATTARLRNVIWGGSPLSLDEVTSLVRSAGFEMVRAGGDPRSTIKGVVGQRPL
ncbi:MAG TPA: methyltransferase domain-containing protein [Chloroflexota bacterium]|nr:methyltransferase domain-containing protein [Chloroflexota bacterium]